MSDKQASVTIKSSRFEWSLLILLIFIPRLLHLNQFFTPDEPLFLTHAREFWLGLTTGDFSQTLGIGYPGVTVAGWSAPFVALLPDDLAAYTAGRVATAFVTGILLCLLYLFAKRLLRNGSAFIGVALLALDPYTLSYSRLLHIATPLALFMTLAGVTLLLWLCERKLSWLVWAGVFTGLALLTKSTALLLGPMLMLLALGWLLTNQMPENRQGWLSIVGAFGLVGIFALLIFWLLWPAMWSQPIAALELTFGKLFTDQAAGTGNLGMFWFGQFVEDPGPGFYPVAFVLKATPWLLIGLLLNLWFLIRSYADKTEPAQNAFALWLFAICYLVIMTIASKKSVRYMLPAFPAFYLLAGMAFFQGWMYLKQWSFLTWFDDLKISFFNVQGQAKTLLLVIPLLLTLFYHPYYFTYYNPALLGWRWAPETLLVGWGEGLDRTTAHLDRQLESPATVWYEWLFPLMYQGPIQPVVPQENLITADQSVLYINQVQRDIPSPNIIHYFQTRRQPDHTVRLAGIDYAWVYPGPIASLDRPAPSPQFPMTGNFANEIDLLGYNLHSQPRSGESLIVTLYWRSLVTPASERFVFLRLLDEQGRVWANSDSPPVMGLWPVERWQPNMLIEDAQELVIPPGTPPGVYRLEVGVYDPTTTQVFSPVDQAVGPSGGLLVGEISVEWQAVSDLEQMIDLPHQPNTLLAPTVRLIGHDTIAASLQTGDLMNLNLLWQDASTIFSGWGSVPQYSIAFIWRNTNGVEVGRQIAEFPMAQAEWGQEAVLRSKHELIVLPTLMDGTYTAEIALQNDAGIVGQIVPLGTLDITAPPHIFDLPATAESFEGQRLSNQISLAGYTLTPIDSGLNLQLYWQTETPLMTRYKVFVQLLSADNSLIAQSDRFPSDGQRPTTGWLPTEMIEDSHQLMLPDDVSPGSYRVIAGLYDPATGQRLPTLNEAGEQIGDFVVITEVSLP